MSKTFFIADTHFGHENSIRFDNRPYSSIEEMDKDMIIRWNSKVNPEDTVYILGDFAFRNRNDVSVYTRQLNGHLKLIRGNHDRRKEQYEKNFESVQDFADIVIDAFGTKKRVVLSHYWMPFTVGQRRGAFMLHGHTHKSEESVLEEILKQQIRDKGIRCEAYNVGCMWQDYFPQTLEEIIARQNREIQS